jgi:GTPase SAR1 family protein
VFLPQLNTYSAFLLFYDISDYNSYLNVKECIDQIKDLCKPENQYILVIGNKNDLPP